METQIATIKKSLVQYQREKLLGFLDLKAFDAILMLPPETYSGNDKEAFETVKKRALDDKRKFHAIRTPEAIKEKFLSSAPVDGLKKNVDRELHYLNNLSAMPQVKEELKKCRFNGTHHYLILLRKLASA